MVVSPRCTLAVFARRSGLPAVLLGILVGWATISSRDASGGQPGAPYVRRSRVIARDCPVADCDLCNGIAGTWYWLRSPDEEKRAIAALYNRYCIRCHGVDGRGVWDIPDVPNFTSARWQASRSDDQLARIIVEGRGAVMPPFRGTLSLEEACAMGRYLRTLLPGAEASRPAADKTEKAEKPAVPKPPGPKSSAGVSVNEVPLLATP
jgi:mono/diheme cytochrome c family protein